jgi:membrane-associated phospholipid phosphatase
MNPEDPNRSASRRARAIAISVPACALVLLAPTLLWSLDQPLFFWFNGLSELTGPAFWAHATILGDGLVCAVLFLPWVRRHPQRVWGGILGALVMVLVLHSLKKLLGLPRPLAVLPEETLNIIGPGLRSRAFPSGHTATFALFAGIWSLTTHRRMVPFLALAGAILVGVSRMVVGVHWPSDVLGGLALGWVSAWIGLRWGARATWGQTIVGRRVLAVALLLAAVVLFFIDHTRYPGVLWFQRGLALVCFAWGGAELYRDIRGSSPGQPDPPVPV